MSITTIDRARVAGLKRHRAVDDPVVEAAVRELKTAGLEDQIRRVVDSAPGLTDGQIRRLTLALNRGPS